MMMLLAVGYSLESNKFSNLSSEETKALISLRKCDDIIIKPSDKSGVMVVWLRQLYLDEPRKQLSDQRFYEKLGRRVT